MKHVLSFVVAHVFLFLFWINVLTVSMINNMVNDIEISMVYLEVQ
jgi:hypothetical protein